LGSSHVTSSGPDMMDVGALMRAIHELHAVDVSLTILPGGGRWPTSVEVLALAVRVPGVVSAAPAAVSRSVPYPNVDSETFEGCLFKLLHELDRDCSGMWRQESLPYA
jgi:hypothetical protein